MIGFLGAASAEHSARSLRASVYSWRNSLWRAIQRKIVALLGIPASLQMARRLLPSASRAQDRCGDLKAIIRGTATPGLVIGHAG
jgi:hypothetical protein